MALMMLVCIFVAALSTALAAGPLKIGGVRIGGAQIGGGIQPGTGSDPAPQSQDDPAQKYCVAQGYLYRTVNTAQGKQAQCVFPDRSYCDAQAYYQGACSGGGYPGQYYLSRSTSSMDMDSGSSYCVSNGGWLDVVHTPFGDQVVCRFPDGSYCDKWDYFNGVCRRGYIHGDWLGSV